MPKDGPSGVTYGPVRPFYRVMFDGFSALDIDYACVFDGQEIEKHCDYGVKLNPKQIVLPKNIKTFPHGDANAVTSYQKWVKRDEFISLLKQAN